ncbi:MAG: hypothetical protein MZV63_46685 [Marinilabiliales bacterium]|nr:hypothetical protein [Marinilabiliales bacterium]
MHLVYQPVRLPRPDRRRRRGLTVDFDNIDVFLYGTYTQCSYHARQYYRPEDCDDKRSYRECS